VTRSASASELFEAYGAMVFRRCRRLLGNDDSAHDAVQEVFLRTLDTRAGFRGDSSALTWLYAIATTHCLQQLRNSQLRAQKLAALAAEGASASDSPRHDERLLWEAILAQLDPDVARIALFRHVDGLTLEQVAAMTGLSRKTVAKKLTQFAATARNLVAEEDPP
jgi:RNA polymerase sigma-70 factor, ECF subfamily